MAVTCWLQVNSRCNLAIAAGALLLMDCAGRPRESSSSRAPPPPRTRKSSSSRAPRPLFYEGLKEGSCATRALSLEEGSCATRALKKDPVLRRP